MFIEAYAISDSITMEDQLNILMCMEGTLADTAIQFNKIFNGETVILEVDYKNINELRKSGLKFYTRKDKIKQILKDG